MGPNQTIKWGQIRASNSFIEVDASREGWEKKLTWDRMKDSLNKRGNPERQPHPAVEALDENDYQTLMKWIRCYRSVDVLELTRYRDIRTHRVAPSVDHPELAVSVAPTYQLASGSPVPFFSQQTAPEYTFLDLYERASKVYRHITKMLLGINEIIHA